MSNGNQQLQRLFMRLQHHLLNLGSFDDDDDDQMEEVEEPVTEETNDEKTAAVKAQLLQEPIAQQIVSQTNCFPNKEQPNCSVYNMLMKREQSASFGRVSKCHITQRMLPQGNPHGSKIMAHYESQTFCGQFSQDGSTFMSACQDKRIRLYNTKNWKKFKEIVARDIGWSIIDIDYSPDQRWLIYSSWSDSIHMCNIYGEEEVHEPLEMKSDSHRFCLFSINFSNDSREILGGSSDRCLYIYDLDARERTLKVNAHTDDVNTVKFADNSNQILISGSDDNLLKVWDRRALGKTGACVGVLVGHLEGITHIDPKGDGRYFISNSKDQSIKLWDIRKMKDPTKLSTSDTKRSNWDYRDYYNRQQRNSLSAKFVHPNDQSLMTYRGHRVFQTLIRCYFSPEVSTGQKYIYTGSYDGCVYLYDVLTGELVQKFDGHRTTVRDVSWHPTDALMLSTSWDGTVRKWQGSLLEQTTQPLKEKKTSSSSSASS